MDDYGVEASNIVSASSFADAVRQAEGWAQDVGRPGIIWRVANLTTGEWRMIDFDDLDEDRDEIPDAEVPTMERGFRADHELHPDDAKLLRKYGDDTGN